MISASSCPSPHRRAIAALITSFVMVLALLAPAARPANAGILPATIIVTTTTINDDPNDGKCSLYEALSSRGFRPTRGLQRLRATLVCDADAELLGVEHNSPALYIQRIAYLVDGCSVEFTKSWYRADAYDFVSELTLSPPVRKVRR